MSEIVPHSGQVGAIRYKLVLGKFPVVKVQRTAFGFDFAMQLPDGVKFIVSVPSTADIKEGDLLTLYTEILSNAKSG